MASAIERLAAAVTATLRAAALRVGNRPVTVLDHTDLFSVSAQQAPCVLVEMVESPGPMTRQTEETWTRDVSLSITAVVPASQNTAQARARAFQLMAGVEAAIAADAGCTRTVGNMDGGTFSQGEVLDMSGAVALEATLTCRDCHLARDEF